MPLNHIENEQTALVVAFAVHCYIDLSNQLLASRNVLGQAWHRSDGLAKLHNLLILGKVHSNFLQPLHLQPRIIKPLTTVTTSSHQVLQL